MKGDFHVRFCERFGVKSPLPTRPLLIVFLNDLSVADLKSGEGMRILPIVTSNVRKHVHKPEACNS